jgi:hypothetical protein
MAPHYKLQKKNNNKYKNKIKNCSISYDATRVASCLLLALLCARAE